MSIVKGINSETALSFADRSRKMLLLAFLFAYVSCLAIADEDWGYVYNNATGELDASHWYIKYSNCIGNRQSPIDVEKDYIQFDKTLAPLIFIGYDKPIPTVNVTNEGHTVRIDVPDNSGYYVTSNSLNKVYKLKQFHFHWGHTDDVGSEHVVFGQRYPLEMHMVHADENVTYDTALTESSGLLVISVLFKFGAENPELKRITDHFPSIVNPTLKTVTTLPNLDVKCLYPENARNYLQYAGSLTTPPCNEAVQWIILTENQQLSHAQMNNFRSLKHETIVDGKVVTEPIEVNDRELQGINGRKVSLYYDFDDLNIY